MPSGEKPSRKSRQATEDARVIKGGGNAALKSTWRLANKKPIGEKMLRWKQRHPTSSTAHPGQYPAHPRPILRRLHRHRTGSQIAALDPRMARATRLKRTAEHPKCAGNHPRLANRVRLVQVGAQPGAPRLGMPIATDTSYCRERSELSCEMAKDNFRSLSSSVRTPVPKSCPAKHRHFSG